MIALTSAQNDSLTVHIYYLAHAHTHTLTQGYENVSINPDDFEGKTVLIIGRGEITDTVNGGMRHCWSLQVMLGSRQLHTLWDQQHSYTWPAGRDTA